MNSLKNLIYGIGFVAAGLMAGSLASCDDWTEPEANDFYEAPTTGYKENLKDYYNSPHMVTYGWFGNWAGKGGSSMQYQLCGLPDSIDFVSLWLVWGNLNASQQADLKDFQASGRRAIFCWRAGNIGDNLTPGGNTTAAQQEFWGFGDDEESQIEAARKYAHAIADTCAKYNVDGFDYDIEDWGTLMNSSRPAVANEFMRTLRERFDAEGRMLVADIPGGTGWLSFYAVLEEDVIESLDYIVWQTYEQSNSGMNTFFNAVKSYHPNVFDNVLAKSIVTTTYEEATKNDKYGEAIYKWRHTSGKPHGGWGAYHIEYDYPGNPDYPTVRKIINYLNPPILN